MVRNNLSSPGDAVGILYHELTHAYDDCKGTDWKDCEEFARSEIRARKISGECQPGGYKNRGACYIVGLVSFEKESDCIKRSAAKSLELSACVPGSKYVDLVFERSVNDLSPFDRNNL